MKKVICLTLIVLAAGCQMLPASYSRSDNPDRPTYTPINPDRPTATDTPQPPTPTATNPDRASVTPDDDPTPPTSTPLPDDWPTTTPTPEGYMTPTATLNPDQLYLTAIAGTPSPSVDENDRATHAALDGGQ